MPSPAMAGSSKREDMLETQLEHVAHQLSGTLLDDSRCGLLLLLLYLSCQEPHKHPLAAPSSLHDDFCASAVCISCDCDACTSWLLVSSSQPLLCNHNWVYLTQNELHLRAIERGLCCTGLVRG